MNATFKIIISIIILLNTSFQIFSQAIVDIDNLSSITFYERTGTTSTFTFNIDDDELNEKLTGQLNSSNNDFQGWVGNEFFDVFFSDGDGTFNSQGMFISIEVRFDISSAGGGGNIVEVEFNFDNGNSIFASHLESFNVNGSNYNPQSELSAVDCDLNTWSTLGNTNGLTENLRLTVGIENTFTEIEYVGCINDGYSIIVNGTTYNESNPIGTETLTAIGGCDSIVNINLDFPNPVETSELNYFGCQNDGYVVEVNGTIYDENNTTGTEVLTSVFGCDSIVEIDLIFNPNPTGEIVNSDCLPNGYSIEVNGNIYDENNPIGTEVVPSPFGCDSIITINLDFESFQLSGEENYVGCADDGYSIVVNGVTYDENNPTGIETLLGGGGCDSTVTINLEFFENTFSDLTYLGCEGDGYSVEVNGNIYSENNPIGTEVIPIGSGCDSIISIQLEFEICDTTITEDCNIYIPNGFTPNGDGYNDFFSIYFAENCEIENFNIKIFNRWGAEVFQSKDTDFRWDGSFKGEVMNTGVFVWYLEYSMIESGEKKMMEGDVTIVK